MDFTPDLSGGIVARKDSAPPPQAIPFQSGDFVAPRAGESLGVVIAAKAHVDVFWTVWDRDPDWCHPEPLDTLRPADIPPPARFLGQLLSNYCVMTQSPVITALRRGIQWHEHATRARTS